MEERRSRKVVKRRVDTGSEGIAVYLTPKTQTKKQSNRRKEKGTTR
jgi:hypothetical protein